ncbi:DUF1515 family protein [Mesorhizobium sp. P5_C1]
MASKLDEISEAIGGLRAEVAALRRDFTDSTRRADDHRASIHKRVDDLVHDVGEAKTSIETMKADVTDSKEITDEFKEWKQRGIGALFVAGIAGTAVGGTAVGFIAYWWDVILKVLRTP